MSSVLKNIQKTFTQQQDQSDCGIACLLSLIQYYGGSNNLDNLRRLSGTTVTGTTLLGLMQAANAAGLTAEGCEADIPALTNHGSPCILHVIVDETLQHYVLYYGKTFSERRKSSEGGLHIIGDPARGIRYFSDAELDTIWRSRACLTVTPSPSFVKTADVSRTKMRWLGNLIKKDMPVLAIAAVLGIAIAALGLTLAVFSQRLVDDILPQRKAEKLYLGIALVLLLLMVKESLSWLRQHFLIKQAQVFNIRIISSFFRQLLQLPKPFFDTRKTGEFTARLTDTTRIQRVISQLAGNVAIDLFVVLTCIIAVFMYTITIGIVCIVLIPLFFWFLYTHNKRIIEGQQAIMISYAQSESNFISTIQGIDHIKESNKQQLFEEMNNNIYQKYQEAVFHLGSIQIKLSFVINICGTVFLGLMLGWCGYLVLNNGLKTGELIAVVSLCSTLLPGIVNLALIRIPFHEARIAFERMFEFANAMPEDENGLSFQHSFSELRVHDLSFRFPGRKPLLQNVSFYIKKAEIIAIIGENGCGKSTLAKLLQKSYSFENGQVMINGEFSLKDVALSEWRKSVALIPQQVHIFSGTVLENIAFDDAVKNTNDVILFLNDYGFTSFIDVLPQSWMTLVGEGGINLSGGQKQIIALARALYRNPGLLILDEATAAMDRQSEEFVLQLLQKIKQQMGIIFITHRLHLLKSLCDKIYILEKGSITDSGSHSHLMQSENLYRRYWDALL